MPELKDVLITYLADCEECGGQGSKRHPEYARYLGEVNQANLKGEPHPGVYAEWLTHKRGYIWKSPAFDAAMEEYTDCPHCKYGKLRKEMTGIGYAMLVGKWLKEQGYIEVPL